jgi:hypothetical protein
VSLQAFQSSLGQLMTGGAADNDPELTDVERCKLGEIALSPGLATVQMLYQSWRLAKVLTLLPMTIEALGDESTELLADFWRHRRARGPYFLEECGAFLDFVEHRKPAVDRPALTDVMAFERARLEMRKALGQGQPPVVASVSFEHDPAAVFRSVRGDGTATLEFSPTKLRGDLWEDGTEQWTIVN